MTGRQMRITADKFCCIWSPLARSTALLVSKKGGCSFIAIGVSNDGKRVLNEVCSTP